LISPEKLSKPGLSFKECYTTTLKEFCIDGIQVLKVFCSTTGTSSISISNIDTEIEMYYSDIIKNS
jgi:hypothetical protein